MSQEEKSLYYQELKAAGVTFDKHYRDYSTDELRAGVLKLRMTEGYEVPVSLGQPDIDPEVEAPQIDEATGLKIGPPPTEAQQGPSDEYAAQHAYSGKGEETPIRTDEQGLIWYREEVKKPAFPAPRARRVLTYVETGSEVQTVSDGKFMESFEVAGKQHHTGNVKITMPSYQVGVYRDPRFPFKIHVYNDVRGFDLFDVEDFYGGSDLVPPVAQRMYVENDLCYDIRSIVRAINEEYRQSQLKGQNA